MMAKRSASMEGCPGSNLGKKARHGYYLRSKAPTSETTPDPQPAPSSNSNTPFTERNAVLEMKLTIKGTSCIDGCAWVSPNMVILSERDRNTVALIDIQRKKVVNRLGCYSNPRNVVKVDDSSIAIVFPEEKMIRIMKIEGKIITFDREIHVSDTCYGLAYDKKSQIFFTTLRNSGDIARYKLNGKPLSPLRLTKAIKSEVKDTYCLTYSEKSRQLFVACYFKSKVLVIGLDGKAVAEYDCHYRPWELELDSDGNIYACGYEGNRLYQLDATGTFIREILTALDGFIDPKALAWSEDMTSFVLATNNSIRQYAFK